MIEPDAGQAGTNGDMVPSNKGDTGEAHYVSPKKTGEFVTFKAKFGSEFAFGDALEWEGGEEVPGSPEKIKVSRGATGKTVLKIKRKSDGVEVARLNVWIVWATGEKAGDRPIQSGTEQIKTGDGSTGPGIVIYGGYNFKFTILPQSIITDNDHPDLRGQNTYNNVVVNPPGSGTLHFIFATDLKGGAGAKWDVSRHIKAKVINPHLYGPTDLDEVPGTLWNNQTVASDIPVSFPSDDRIGNDDTSTGDEDNDPYSASSKLNNTHAVGEITSTDAPNQLMRHSTGADGDSFELRYHFREFSRILIGDEWYRCSDFLEWRAHFTLKRQNGTWANDGSSLALDNNGF